MTHQQLLGVWILVGSGFLACSVVALIWSVIAIAQEGRRGGARGGRSRPEAGFTDGSCRRGEGAPRRVYDDAMVDAFLRGQITIDQMRKYHNERSE